MQMAPSTALLFVLYGIAAFLRARLPTHRGAHRAGLALDIAGTLAAASLLFLSSLGIHPAVEHLGFQAAGTVDGAPTGHMSPVTALCFIVAGFSLFASPPSVTAWSRRARAAWWLASLLIATSLALLLAYLFGAPLFYTGSVIPPAVTSIVAFVALGIALLGLARPHARSHRPEEERLIRAEYALLLAFLLLAAGIVTVGYLYQLGHDRRYRVEVEHRISAIAEMKVRDVVQYRKERLGDAAIFFRNASFSGVVRRFLERPVDAGFRRELLAWIGNYGALHEIDRISLLDAGGVTRISVPDTPEPADSTVSNRAPEIARSGRMALQDFYRNERDRKIRLAVLVPILDEREGGRPLGVIVLRIDPARYLYPLISHWPVFSRTAETLLVRRDGNHALYLNELKFEKDTALTLRVPLDPNSESPAVKAVLGKRGILEGRDYRGQPVLADVREIPDSPWFVVARMDLSEVHEPARARLWWMVSLVCAMLLAAGAGVGLAWRQQQARFHLERHEVKREHAWLQDVISRSLDEIHVFDPTTFRFKFVNAGGLRNTGYGMEELASMTPVDVMPEYTMDTFRAIVQPLVSGEREVLVLKTVHRRKDGSGYPVEVHLQLVSAAAGVVFLAVISDITERERAGERDLRNREELRRLACHLQEKIEVERRRIAREIHDELGQQLTALKNDLAWAESRVPGGSPDLAGKIRSMSQLVDATTRSVHDIIHELRPLLLDDLGLPEAIDWQVSEFRRRSGIALELDGVLDDFDLDPDEVTAVFRLLQEMLTNVARHSGAKRCQVRIRRRGTVVYLSVRDDGTGIPADRVADPGSFGLLGMRERARTLGGRFRIRGVPGKGTIVAVAIHVRAAAGSPESEEGT